jgi:hypothetical protein
MRASAIFRLGACVVAAAALSLPLHAYDEEDGNGRRSTWEPGTSLTFHRYLEPFSRLPSARACRDRCVEHRRCSGWTYYDANFRDAGPFSYRLQRVCVIGTGLKGRKASRPGRTSGLIRPQRDGDCHGPDCGDENGRSQDYQD